MINDLACPVCRSKRVDTRYEFEWGNVVQCRDCTCAFSDGCDAEVENQSEFSNGHPDESVELYRQWARERLNTLLRFVDSGQLLEFGPGTGEFLYTAAQEGFKAVGVDRYPRIRPENQHDSASVIVSDARSFVGTKPFEVVAALHVLEHFANPYEFMESIRRNLATDGFALLEVPNYASLSRVAAGRRWNCFVGYHALQLTPASIKSLLEKSGFKLTHIESVGCSTTQMIGLGLPSIGRRIGIPIKYGWEPNGMLRRIATSFEKKLYWGYNLRVVAQRV